MSVGGRRSPATVGLGALLLGLLSAPWVYVMLFDALSAFPSPFAAVGGLLLLGATLELGLEAFGRLHALGGRIRLLGATLSAGIVLMSLWVLSNFTLLNQVERWGLFSTVWLGASLVWLVVSLPLGGRGPEVLLRSRLTTVARQRAALVTVLLLFGVLSALSWRYLTTPAAFIGGPTSPNPIG